MSINPMAALHHRKSGQKANQEDQQTPDSFRGKEPICRPADAVIATNERFDAIATVQFHRGDPPAQLDTGYRYSIVEDLGQAMKYAAFPPGRYFLGLDSLGQVILQNEEYLPRRPCDDCPCRRKRLKRLLNAVGKIRDRTQK